MKNILFRDGFFDDFVGNYCNDLDAKIKDTDKEIDKFNKSSVGNRALKGKQVETDLSKCRALLQNLKNISGGDDEKIQKITHYGYQINQLETKYVNIKNSNNNKNLNERDLKNKEKDQRTTLLEGNQKVGYTGDRLKDTRMIAQENERIGGSTLVELHRQRNVMEKGINDLEEIDSGVDRARKAITAMGRSIITNHLILIFIIVILGLSIGIIVYFKWIRHFIFPK